MNTLEFEQTIHDIFEADCRIVVSDQLLRDSDFAARVYLGGGVPGRSLSLFITYQEKGYTNHPIWCVDLGSDGTFVGDTLQEALTEYNLSLQNKKNELDVRLGLIKLKVLFSTENFIAEIRSVLPNAPINVVDSDATGVEAVIIDDESAMLTVSVDIRNQPPIWFVGHFGTGETFAKALANYESKESSYISSSQRRLANIAKAKGVSSP